MGRLLAGPIGACWAVFTECWRMGHLQRAMADPLSIAASIVGLLAAVGKVYDIISEFVSLVNEAPESANLALVTLQGLSLAL
jgi:hypothetical protein